MNYAEHTRELHGEGVHNEEPVIFMKPDSAVIQKGKPFFLPDYSKRVDYETELVVGFVAWARISPNDLRHVIMMQ